MLRRSKTDEGGGGAVPVEGARILLVADDEDAAITLTRFFEHRKLAVEHFTDLNEVLARVASEAGTDLVLVDLHQGGTSQGLKLLEQIRSESDPEAARTRLVMTTDIDENRMFSWQSGIDGFLVRPFHADELLDAIVGALGRTDSERAAYRHEQMGRASDPRSRREAGEPLV